MFAKDPNIQIFLRKKSTSVRYAKKIQLVFSSFKKAASSAWLGSRKSSSDTSLVKGCSYMYMDAIIPFRFCRDLKYYWCCFY